MNITYDEFLEQKRSRIIESGFDCGKLPDYLFDFQEFIVRKALKIGKYAVFADCGLGKGQPYGSKILTPNGWVNIENLKIGDSIYSSKGIAQKVTGVFPKGEIKTYRFHYSDRVSCVFDEDHLHICRTNNDRQRGKDWRVLSTTQLLQIPLRYGKQRSRNFDIPLVNPIEFNNTELPINPYVLGVLIGDGSIKYSINYCNPDLEITEKIKSVLPIGLSVNKKGDIDYSIITPGGYENPIKNSLVDLGLFGKGSHEKFIPEVYLFSSVENRIELLRGLMDTDGYTDASGSCQYYTTSEVLVGDATINGSETGTSFKQALFFIECGFRLHDTMIYAKENYIPLTHNRYEQSFEYMFVFSKGRPSTFNPIKEKTLYGGVKYNLKRKGYCATIKEGSQRRRDENITTNEFKIKSNIFYYTIGSEKVNHPAPFSESLASDHIKTWSNEGDLIYDPFGGSGTTAKMAHLLKRNWILSEISKEYCDTAQKRIQPYLNQLSFF